MEKLLGPSKVSVREGIRRVIEASQTKRVSDHHVIGQPEAAD
jgi:UDP-glucuronate 4-epimerase